MRPMGVIQMTPYQKMMDLRYGDVCACDAQMKYRNSLGWIYWSCSGSNNNNKLNNFCDALTLQETDHFLAFALRARCEMSGRPLSSLRVIAVDGKMSEEYLRSHLPGKLFWFFCHSNKNGMITKCNSITNPKD